MHIVDIHFSDDFGSDVGSRGIMSAKTLEKCPAWSGTTWLSWTGVERWEADQNLRIRCQDGKYQDVSFIRLL